MKKARQDAWSKEEDMFLATTVLYHISNGKTQLEAFQYAAEELDRTSAACGFRWNAEVRKSNLEAVETAKSERKSMAAIHWKDNEFKSDESIDSVIMMLERVKAAAFEEEKELEPRIAQLINENECLQEKVKRYEEAWREMERLWQWIDDTNDNKK